MSRTNMPVSVIIYYHSFFFENMQESFELFNQKGQRMKVINTGSASQTETIIVSDLSHGLYLLKASNGEETMEQKIIKS